MIQKPSYRTSKLALWLSSAMAWAVMIVLAIGAMLGSEQAVRLADIMVPYLVALIISILGIHRAGGSFDMWSMLRHQAKAGGDT